MRVTVIIKVASLFIIPAQAEINLSGEIGAASGVRHAGRTTENDRYLSSIIFSVFTNEPARIV